MPTGRSGSGFAPINPPGGSGGTQIPVNYELTSTAGPGSDGIIYNLLAAKTGTFSKLGYVMETAASVNTVISITDGTDTVTGTIPSGSNNGTVNLSASITVSSGETLKLTVTSGSGGVPSALFLQ